MHQLGDKPRRTWKEAAIRWLQETDHKADHNKDISKLVWLDQCVSNVYLDEINRELVDHIGQSKRKQTSAATANRYLAPLKSIFRMARDEWEWVDRIPSVRLFQEPKKRVRWITREEANLLITKLPKHFADMAAFTLAIGLRQRNVSYLR